MGREPASSKSLREEWSRTVKPAINKGRVAEGIAVRMETGCFVQLHQEIKMSVNLSCPICLLFHLQRTFPGKANSAFILASFCRHKRAGAIWLQSLSLSQPSQWMAEITSGANMMFFKGVSHSEHIWEALQGNMINKHIALLRKPSFQ